MNIFKIIIELFKMTNLLNYLFYKMIILCYLFECKIIHD